MSNKKSNSRKGTNRTLRTIITIILLIVVAYYGGDDILSLLTAQAQNVTTDTVQGLDNVIVQTGKGCISKIDVNEDVLRVYYFDVGNADSILIVNNGESMLIDAGKNDSGKLVTDNIRKIGINKLTYVVGTHPHEDHIGGLDDVINNIDVGTIMMPKTTQNTKTYEDVIDAVSRKKKKITVPKVGHTFSVGNAKCEVMSIEDNSENLNACSIVIRLEYNGTSYLFMGDAETVNESARSWPQTNVLKAGHHGSSTSSSKKFLNQVKPSLAIISCGKNNDYGHPHKEILDRFNKLGLTVYRTDESGDVLIIQGKDIENNAENTTENNAENNDNNTTENTTENKV